MRLLSNKRGMMGIVLGLVITLVALAVILGVGLLVNANIQKTIGALDLGEAGNATRTVLNDNINAAFNLSAIVPIIAGAALVIGAIVAGFAIRGRAGG